MPGAIMIAATAVLAVSLGVLTAVQPGAAAALAGVIALIAVLLSMRPRLRPVDLASKRFAWVVLAWAFLLIQPIGHFTTGRSSLAAVAGAPSAENVIELAVNAAIAAFAVISLKRNRFDWRPSGLILSLPVLGLLSAAWSLAPNVTLGFSFELLATVLLATLTAAIVNADPALGQSLVRRTLRLVVQGLTLLCVAGLVFRGSWITVGGVTRFNWPGVHPLVAAAEVGFAFLILVFGGRRAGGFSRPARAGLLVLFGFCLYFGQARTAFAGLAVSGLFGYWFVSKGSGPLRRLVGAATIAAILVVLVMSFGGTLTQYLYRGQSQQQVAALNGRVGLWTDGLQQLHGPGRWLVGYGLGGTRVLFTSSTTWAADAHSAWLELLLSLGLVGVVVGVWLVVAIGARLLRSAPGAPPPSRVLPILFVYVLVMSPAAAGFGAPGPEPGLGFALLGFCYAATAASQPRWSQAGRRAQLEGGLLPAPI